MIFIPDFLRLDLHRNTNKTNNRPLLPSAISAIYSNAAVREKILTSSPANCMLATVCSASPFLTSLRFTQKQNISNICICFSLTVNMRSQDNRSIPRANRRQKAPRLWFITSVQSVCWVEADLCARYTKRDSFSSWSRRAWQSCSETVFFPSAKSLSSDTKEAVVKNSLHQGVESIKGIESCTEHERRLLCTDSHPTATLSFPFGHVARSMVSSSKGVEMVSWEANSWYVESVAEYLSHDE